MPKELKNTQNDFNDNIAGTVTGAVKRVQHDINDRISNHPLTSVALAGLAGAGIMALLVFAGWFVRPEWFARRG